MLPAFQVVQLKLHVLCNPMEDSKQLSVRVRPLALHMVQPCTNGPSRITGQYDKSLARLKDHTPKAQSDATRPNSSRRVQTRALWQRRRRRRQRVQRDPAAWGGCIGLVLQRL